MTRRARVWRAVAVVFTVVNVGGVGYAALSAEPVHAAVHVGLVVATYLVWRLLPRARRLDLPHAHPAEERLDRLQESLDAIAIEVERIGEAQRYAVKVVAERVRSSLPESVDRDGA
jgi:hypothetical protein